MESVGGVREAKKAGQGVGLEIGGSQDGAPL